MGRTVGWQWPGEGLFVVFVCVFKLDWVRFKASVHSVESVSEWLVIRNNV